jgi:hypothetical protein
VLDDKVTFPGYAYNAQGGVVCSGDYRAVKIDFFLKKWCRRLNFIGLTAIKSTETGGLIRRPAKSSCWN